MKKILLSLAILLAAAPLFVMAATPPLNGPQGGTGVSGIKATYIPFGGSSILRVATSTNLFWTDGANRLNFTYASTTALSAVTLCLTGDTCRTSWPTSGSSGTVSTSTNETAGALAYWTSNSATPALLGKVATGTISGSGGVTVTAAQSIIGSGLTITCTGASAGATGCLSSTDWSTFNNKQATIGVTWPITLSGATVGFNGLSTSTAAVVGNIPYYSGVNTFANVATTTASCAGTASCTAFTIIGSSPITITASGGGGGGSVSTSTNEVANQVAVFTSSSATPALVGGDTDFTFSGNLLKITQASSTIFSNTGTSYFGGTATSTFSSAGVLTLISPLAYGSGGTGTTTAPQGQLLYGGATAYQSVATSSASCTTGVSCSAFTVVGTVAPSITSTLGTSVDLTSEVTGDLPFSSLAQVSANSVLGNITGSTADAASVATSSLYAGTDGQVLARVSGTWTGVATTTLSTITGTLAVAKGGTALTTFGGTNTLLYTSSADTLTSLAQGGANVVLTANSGAPAWSASPTINTSVTTPLFFASAGGSASAPPYSFTGDTNNGIFSTGADTLNFGTAGTEFMRITSAGLLLIGTTTANPYVGIVFASTTPVLSFTDTNAGTDKKHIIMGNYDGIFRIGTTSDALSGTSTAFSIDPAGAAQLGIATSTPWRTLSVVGTVAINGLTSSTAGNAVCILASFDVVTAGNTTCVTSSAKTKHDILSISETTAQEVMQLRPVQYINNEGGDARYGLIAEEVNKIDPMLVEYAQNDTTFADGQVIKKGEPIAVDYQRYTGLLTKFVQDLSGRVDQLSLGRVKRSAEENWQWAAIVVLILWNVALTIRKRNDKN